MFQRYDVTANL